MAKNHIVAAATDVAEQAYMRLVRTADAIFSQVNSGLPEHQISPTQFSTLKALKFYGPLSQREIGRYILKTGGNVTVIVDQLEAMGYASRLRDSEDRRVCYVNLTDKGDAFFNTVYPSHLERIRISMKNLSESEQAALSHLLEQVWADDASHHFADAVVSTEK